MWVLAHTRRTRGHFLRAKAQYIDLAWRDVMCALLQTLEGQASPTALDDPHADGDGPIEQPNGPRRRGHARPRYDRQRRVCATGTLLEVFLS